MKNFLKIIRENRKEAVKLMRDNNVTKIDFIDKNGEHLICGVPIVIYKGLSNEPLELLIKSVRIDENDYFFVMPDNEYMTNELDVDDLAYETDNRIYLAIGKYFETV